MVRELEFFTWMKPGHEKPLMRQGITKKEMPLPCVVQAFLTPSLSFLLSQQ